MACPLKNIVNLNSVRVEIPFGHLDKIMHWCRENCTGCWHIADNEGERPVAVRDGFNTYEFEFEDERDYITFNLKWK